MSIIYLLIPIAIIFTAIGIYFFFWAVKSEQFSDLEKQGMSILFDDEPVNLTKQDELTEITPIMKKTEQYSDKKE